jgi:cyclopropane fatty-acyl-phospholipid synthase-like methyltransferase
MMIKNCLSGLFFLAVIAFTGCDEPKKDKPYDKSHMHPDHDANAHMHQSSTKELIKRFSNPDRDQWQKPNDVLRAMKLDSNMTVMDIGCGSGYFSLRLASMVTKVIAADVEEAFLIHVQKMADSLSLNNIDTMKIPLEGPENVKTPLDRLLIVNTYHHISNREDYFHKLRHWMGKDGILFIVDFKKHLNSSEIPGPPKQHKLSSDVVIDELGRAGWQEIEVDTVLLPYQYIVAAR